MEQSQLKPVNNQIIQQLLDGIQNPRIRQIILEHPSIESLYQNQNKKVNVNSLTSYLTHVQQRKWLNRKGKKYLIDFNEEQRQQMKQYFNALDQQQKGSIGIDQLEQLLLSVGLADNRQQVKTLIDSVDQDKSGKIEFQQFLSMIQNDDGPNQKIVAFFKNIMKSNSKILQQSLAVNFNNKKNKNISASSKIIQVNQYPKKLPFDMIVSQIRRNHMISALNIGNSSTKTAEKQDKGQSVMNALKKMWERKMIKKMKQEKSKIQASTKATNFTKNTF